MVDLDPVFNQKDISDENGPVNTFVDGASKTRLGVNCFSPPGSSSSSPVVSSKLRVLSSVTPVVLTATYQTIYSYSGSGKLMGFDLKFSKSGGALKLTVDGEVIFDLVADEIDLLQNLGKVGTGVPVVNDSTKNSLNFNPEFSIAYSSSVLIEAKRALSNPDIDGYIVCLTKET